MPRLSRSTLLDGRASVLVVVLGGLFALQSSNNLDATKVAYLLLAALALIGAVAIAPRWLPEMRASAGVVWLIATGSVIALLVISLAVARVEGTSLTSWLRDASAYALLGVAPVLAMACAYSASRRWLAATLVVAGLVASFSFAVEWVGRRDIAVLPIDRIGLPTETLAAALLALATAFALAGTSRKWLWAALGGTVLGLFFITGSRSTLLLLVVPVGAAIFAGRPWRPTIPVLLIEAAVALAVFFACSFGFGVANGTVSIPVISPTASAGSPSGSPDKLGQRVSQVGTLVTDPGSDQSLQERLTQTKVAWDAFITSPIFGVGPGHNFHWVNTTNLTVDAFTLDTPVVYLAKFGLVGLVPLVLFAVAYLQLVLSLWRRRQSARIEYLALVGFALIFATLILQSFPIEDKGTSFALILLIALGLHGLRGRDGIAAEASTNGSERQASTESVAVG